MASIVSLNRFPGDTDADLEQLADFCSQHGVASAASEAFSKGGPGAKDLAEPVVETIAASSEPPVRPIYSLGPLVFDEDGLAVRGLLIRQLVMPGLLEETQSILNWIARELRRDTYVNLMAQYFPTGKVSIKPNYGVPRHG